MPGQDVTEIPPYLECISDSDGDKDQSRDELEARIAAMEEQEKRLADSKEALLNDIQHRLRQGLVKDGLVQEGKNNE